MAIQVWTSRHRCGPRQCWYLTLFAVLVTVVISALHNFYTQDSVFHHVIVSENSVVSSSSAVSKPILFKDVEDKSTLKDTRNSIMVDVSGKQRIPVKTYTIPKTIPSRKRSLMSSHSQKKQTSAKTKAYNSSVPSIPSSQTASETGSCGDIKFRTRNKTLAYFRPVLTGGNLCSMLAIMDAFTAAMEQANISYFMCGGTLLGSWRHHGFIPWDDDLDFSVPTAHRQRVYRLLMDLKPRFILDVKQKIRWKLFRENGHPIRAVSWKYPFLDINFYDEDSTYVWDRDIQRYKNFRYPRDWVFPLQRRPFQDRWLWSPKKTEDVLRVTYRLEECETSSYNHRKESRIPLKELKSVTCGELQSLLPFVKHTPVEGGCNETLEQNGHVLSYFLDNNAC